MKISSWFRGLKGRLFLSSIVPVGAAVASGIISYQSLHSLGSMLNESYSVLNPNIMVLGKINEARAGIGDGINQALVFHDAPEPRQRGLAYSERSFQNYLKAKKDYLVSAHLPEEAGMMDVVESHHDEFVKLVEEAHALLKEGTPEADAKVKAFMGGKFLKLIIEINQTVDGIREVYDIASTERLVLQDEKRTFAFNLIVLVGLISVVLTAATLMWTAHSITKIIAMASHKIQGASNEVTHSIAQLSSAGDSLSNSSASSAASLEETVAALEEMTSMIQMNTDNAKQAATLSLSSREAAERGEHEIKNLVLSMQDISKSSKKIEEIIDVIDDIAFQTNLLALNASVEAARAGEHGKGFAVVAEAVRGLAQRSATAAKEITGLIKSSVEQIEGGTTIADKSGEVMNEIVTSVKKVSDLSNEIAAASSEQSTGIQQISKAMNQLDQGAQQNAASSEEIAASSREISNQTVAMQSFVRDLNQAVLGVAEIHDVPKAAPKKAKETSQKSASSEEPKKKASPVVKFDVKKKKVAAAATKPDEASSVIPFDEDDERSELKDTSGF